MTRDVNHDGRKKRGAVAEEGKELLMHKRYRTQTYRIFYVSEPQSDDAKCEAKSKSSEQHSSSFISPFTFFVQVALSLY